SPDLSGEYRRRRGGGPVPLRKAFERVVAPFPPLLRRGGLIHSQVPSSPPMLVFDDLHKSFGDIRALDGCSFRVAPGRMLGFLGPNGAGKTTAMRAVFDLVKPDSGQVLWNG